MSDEVKQILESYNNDLANYLAAFYTASYEQQAQILDYVAQISQDFLDQNTHFIDVLSGDNIPDALMGELSNLYTSVQDQIKRFPQRQAVRGGAADSIYAPPRVTTNSANKLSENIKSLRSYLYNIHRLLNSAQDATEISFDEKYDQIQSRDISVMAVNQLKATTKVQNEQLKAEVANLRAYVADLLDENKTYKQKATDASHQLDMLRDENDGMRRSLDQLTEEKRERSGQLDLVQQERDKYRARYENLKEQVDIEQQRAASEKEQRYARVTELESEKNALVMQVQKLKERLTELESYDVETASLEVQRAAKTVEQLNGVIEDLKRKLIEQKKQYNDHIQQLRTTIAVLSEEIYGDDQADGEEHVPREELEKRIAALMQQNEQLYSTVEEYQSKSQMQTSYAAAANPGLQLSSMVPVYANPESMLNSISLYNGKKAADAKDMKPKKPEEDDVVAIINQRRK